MRKHRPWARTLAAAAFLSVPVMVAAQEPPPGPPPEPELVFEREVFELLVTYESPPLDELQTVPLFDEESVSTQTAAPARGN